MSPTDVLRLSDAAVVARYLHVRALFHDGLLARLERLVPERYEVQLTRRVAPTLVAQVRSGFVRAGEGEIWPVVFLTPAEVSVALCVEITAESLASLGTLLNGPQRLRHRYWEDWWGWEAPLGEVHPQFFELPADKQQDALVAWYLEGFEWLVHSGLLRRVVPPSR
jgi:hypothetical protein